MGFTRELVTLSTIVVNVVSRLEDEVGEYCERREESRLSMDPWTSKI